MATITVSDSIQTYENVMFNMYDSHYNNAYSTIATAPSPAASGTQITLATGDGANFSPGTYNAVIWPTSAQPSNTNSEIVRVVGRSGDILQIQRTQENSAARSIQVGDQIAGGITAKTLTDIESGGLLTSSAFAVGPVVQMVNVVSGAVATGTTVLPVDDTIPQNTEGDQYMTLAITPKSTTNRLVIDVRVFGAINLATGNTAGIALFQDTTVGALAASAFTVAGSGYVFNLPLLHDMAAGTTSATTFKVRAGPQSAGTFTFNGASAGRLFGGITLSSMTIWEVKA